eukprot:scaffold38345_cov18-Tisochrysis_lutea.AAC.3
MGQGAFRIGRECLQKVLPAENIWGSVFRAKHHIFQRYIASYNAEGFACHICQMQGVCVGVRGGLQHGDA